MKRITLFLSFLVLISACMKQKDFVIDLNIVRAHNGIGLNGKVSLKYFNGGEKYLELGKLENGRLNVVANVPKSINSGELHIYLFDDFYQLPGYSPPMIKTVYRNGGPIVIALKPITKMTVSVENSNCYDATDSVWVNFLGSAQYFPHLYTGCMSGVPGNLPNWHTDDLIQFETISKKNGLYDTLLHEFYAVPEVYNAFTIYY